MKAVASYTLWLVILVTCPVFFVGALAVSLREDRNLERAAAFATRAASLSVGRPGTMPSYPTRDELPATPTLPVGR